MWNKVHMIYEGEKCLAVCPSICQIVYRGVLVMAPSVCQDGKPGEESNKYTGGIIYVLKERG